MSDENCLYCNEEDCDILCSLCDEFHCESCFEERGHECIEKFKSNIIKEAIAKRDSFWKTKIKELISDLETDRMRITKEFVEAKDEYTPKFLNGELTANLSIREKLKELMQTQTNQNLEKN